MVNQGCVAIVWDFVGVAEGCWVRVFENMVDCEREVVIAVRA